MGTLGNPKSTLEIINKYEFAFQKKFGQNFLIDSNIVEKIVRDAGVTKDDFVQHIIDNDPGFDMFSFEGFRPTLELIKSIVEVSSSKKIVFSHFGSREEDFPILTINIKNGFRCKK